MNNTNRRKITKRGNLRTTLKAKRMDGKEVCNMLIHETRRRRRGNGGPKNANRHMLRAAATLSHRIMRAREGEFLGTALS
jgi:hypothetical protein